MILASGCGHWAKDPLVAAAGEFANQVDFMLAIGSSIRIKNIVEPHRRLFQNIRPLPGIPRQIGLGLSVDQAPVDGRHMVFHRNGKIEIEQATGFRSEERRLGKE